MMEPTKGDASEKVKLAIASLYAVAPILLVAHSLLTGSAPDTTVLLIVIIFMFASAYVIFGERTVDKATEQAKEVAGDGDDGE